MIPARNSRGARPVTVLAALACVALLLSALTGGHSAPPVERPRSLAVPLEADGIENLYRLTDHVYSGGEPRGPVGFAALQRLGVRTVLSVDGAGTDVGTARRHGLRYVHLPIGYDGIGDEQRLRIVKAVRSLPGPLFIHCHHGRHRGPAAAALACMARDGWSQEQALAWMKDAGTSPDYPGLYRTVREFTVPSPAALENVPDDFPERAAVPPLVETMVAISRHWEHLSAIRRAGWTAPADHPDLDPPHEARLLGEQFRELARTGAQAAADDAFRRGLSESAAASGRLESLLRQLAAQRTEPLQRAADKAYRTVQQSCKACHQTHRDGVGPVDQQPGCFGAAGLLSAH